MRAPFRKRFLILQIEQMRGTKAITKIARHNTDTTMFANYLLEQIQQTFVCGSHGWGRELERRGSKRKASRKSTQKQSSPTPGGLSYLTPFVASHCSDGRSVRATDTSGAMRFATYNSNQLDSCMLRKQLAKQNAI